MSLLEQYEAKLKASIPKDIKKKRKEPLWTHEIRVCLFKHVIEVFGSAENYQKQKPSVQKEFSKQIAGILSEKYKEIYSNGGPNAQIAWALTKQKALKGTSQAVNFIKCKAAALDAGLIKPKDLSMLLKKEETDNEST